MVVAAGTPAQTQYSSELQVSISMPYANARPTSISACWQRMFLGIPIHRRGVGRREARRQGDGVALLNEQMMYRKGEVSVDRSFLS